jgi:hypothetical protein
VAPTPLTFSLFTWGAAVANSPPAQPLPCLYFAARSENGIGAMSAEQRKTGNEELL